MDATQFQKIFMEQIVILKILRYARLQLILEQFKIMVYTIKF
jgi:hypothetical protein